MLEAIILDSTVAETTETNPKRRKRTKKRTVYDEIVDLKRDQSVFKRDFNTKFLIELEEILIKCFAPTKRKKEHFITKEKLTLDFLKLLQTQKRFKPCNSTHQQLLDMAIFDTVDNIIGKIVQINCQNRIVEIITLPIFRNKQNNVYRSFSEVVFFDYYSIQMLEFYKQQHIYYQDYSYSDVFAFLCAKNKDNNYLEKFNEATRYSFGKGLVSADKRSLDSNKDIKDI